MPVTDSTCIMLNDADDDADDADDDDDDDDDNADDDGGSGDTCENVLLPLSHSSAFMWSFSWSIPCFVRLSKRAILAE